MSSVLVHRQRAAELEQLEPAAWRLQLLERARAGMRPLTIYGRRDGEHVLVTSVLEDGAGLQISRTRVDPARGYHELTSELPALHCFERELHEQHHVRIAGHPWQKPIRFEGQPQAAMNAYPFYRVEGKEVHEVAVGPIHAGVIEPGAFRFMCYGEHVLHLEIQLGYQHRGVEARLLQGDPRRWRPWSRRSRATRASPTPGRTAPRSRRSPEVSVAPEIELARGIALELERIAMHLAGLAGLAADLGFLAGASTYGRLRTTAINTSMRLCGSRFGRGAVRPGGSGLRLDDELRTVLREGLALLLTDGAIIDECFLAARSVRHRLAGVGVVTEEMARQLGLVGMIARSSGIPIDVRRPARGIYATYPIDVRLEPTGDCWARAGIRIEEIRASLRWLETVAEEVPALAPSRTVVPALSPETLAIAVVEGWRGEVVHCLETNADGGLIHYKVQDPSLRNWMGLALAVRGNDISDFPICNKSFDLSYCGNDL
ncbi:MAG: hydrogenase [Myxococcales bacterium]|nr:hydrogenase [Myxococcales bacterium]